MAPKYTFTYFNVKALGEPIRLLFSYGNIDFEDKRINQEDWPKLKATMPAGQMPILEVDGKLVYQSTSIARYLGKLVGLAGDNEWEALEIDVAVDTIHDLRLKVIAAFYDTNEAAKEEKYRTTLAEYIPFMINILEGMAKKNNGHMALGKLTWADFVLTGIADYLNLICRRDVFADSPNLKKVVDNVMALPAVKAWYAKAPKCEF